MTPPPPPAPRTRLPRSHAAVSRLRLLLGAWAVAWGLTAPGAQAMELVTADFPALISPQGRDAPGPLGDFLVLLCERAGWDLQPHFYPFARATLMARTGHQVLMAPLARTPERELLYRWLVPLYTQRYALIGLRSRWPEGIAEAEARTAKVITLRGAISTASLQRKGFRNVSQEAGYEQILRRMDDGSAGLIYGAVPVVMAALKASGRSPQDWVVGPSFDQSELWMVGTPDLTESQVQALKDAFEKIKHDGEHQRLLQRIGVLHGPAGL